jgi:hypothetical protein
MRTGLKSQPHPELFPRIATDTKTSEDTQSTYAPLPSIWDGDDAELLEMMLDFYPRRRPKKILDATVNGGRFWKGSSRPVVGMDIDPKQKPDVVGDNPRYAL